MFNMYLVKNIFQLNRIQVSSQDIFIHFILKLISRNMPKQVYNENSVEHLVKIKIINHCIINH